MAFGLDIKAANGKDSLSPQFAHYQMYTEVVVGNGFQTVVFPIALDQEPLLVLKVNAGETGFARLQRINRNGSGKFVSADIFVGSLNGAGYRPTNTIQLYVKMSTTFIGGGYGLYVHNDTGDLIYNNAYKPLKVTYLARVQCTDYAWGSISITTLFGSPPASSGGYLNAPAGLLFNFFNGAMYYGEAYPDSYIRILLAQLPGVYTNWSGPSYDSEGGWPTGSNWTAYTYYIQV